MQFMHMLLFKRPGLKGTPHMQHFLKGGDDVIKKEKKIHGGIINWVLLESGDRFFDDFHFLVFFLNI